MIGEIFSSIDWAGPIIQVALGQIIGVVGGYAVIKYRIDDLSHRAEKTNSDCRIHREKCQVARISNESELRHDISNESDKISDIKADLSFVKGRMNGALK